MMSTVTAEQIAKIPLVKQLALPEILQRGIFRINMGAKPFADAVGHHILPLDARKQYGDLLAKAAEGGFDINSSANGMWVKQSDHIGRHEGYSQAALGMIGEIDRRLSPVDTALELQKLSDKLRRMTDIGEFGPWYNKMTK